MFYEQLSQVLEESYTLISKVEASMVVSKSKQLNLSINEVHMLEVIGKGPESGRTISEIAAALNITLSSVTIAVNKLEKKQYVVKRRDTEDGRVVYVQLTPSGQHVNRLHKRFHRNMAASIAKEFTEEEKVVLLSSIQKMNSYLKHKVEIMEANK